MPDVFTPFKEKVWTEQDSSKGRSGTGAVIQGRSGTGAERYRGGAVQGRSGTGRSGTGAERYRGGAVQGRSGCRGWTLQWWSGCRGGVVLWVLLAARVPGVDHLGCRLGAVGSAGGGRVQSAAPWAAGCGQQRADAWSTCLAG
eukprot:364760-Chlamydomonas_euryale.AAC.2